jgi:hypothetical protein
MDEQPRTISFSSRFAIGDIVYLRVRRERFAGMIVAIMIREDSSPIYYVTWENCDERSHFACELTREFVPNFESD